VSPHCFVGGHVAHAADKRADLAAVAAGAYRRAQRYSAFGAALARALGMGWQPIPVDDADTDVAAAVDALRWLTMCFDRARQVQWLDIPAASTPRAGALRVEAGIDIQELAGSATAIAVESIAVDVDNEDEHGLTPLIFSQSIQRMVGGSAAGVIIKRIEKCRAGLPPQLFYAAK
jgi:hypothetical protein